MDNFRPEELRAALRRDFHSFVQRVFDTLNPGETFHDNWHLRYIASALQDCVEGPTKRLIINLPPRNLKSIIASVAFPLFILGHDPTARVICVSYGQELADTFARQRLIIARSDWYHELFPNMRLADRQAVSEFATTQQGFCLATSIGGALTGRGADYIVLDDPLKPEDALSDALRERVNDYFANTLYTRLNDKTNGRIILVMQRLHQLDLVNHVQTKEAWDSIVLSAIAAEDLRIEFETFAGREVVDRKAGEALHAAREPLDALNRIRGNLGPYNFDAQYLQVPSPLGGGMVKRSWFQTYTALDKPERFDQIVQSWDTASKPSELNSYSVCTTWGVIQGRIYLLHVHRQRMDYPTLKQAVMSLRARFNATVVLIEDKSSGTSLIQELIAAGIPGIQGYKPSDNKVMRMSAQTSTIHSGLVYLPDQAPWLEDYLAEITTFPACRFTDQTDSTSQALDYIRQQSIWTLDKMKSLISHYSARPRPRSQMVRLKAPPGSSPNFCVLNSGMRTVDADGTALVTQDQAELLLRSGWTPA